MIKQFLCLALMLFSAVVFSQSPVRKLPGIINHPSLHVYAPYISADGNALLFVSNRGQDGALMVSYATRAVDWNAPVDVPKHVITRLNFLRGYALSADGKEMYLTSAKTPVIGGYDIFISRLKGNTWSAPENMMLPINSKANDGCPSITPDGKAMYFMRCDKMDAYEATGCTLFRAVLKPNGQWAEPVALPAYINTGNSQTPRIMADNETLIFSSDKMPGNKGGMDLYLTRFREGQWSDPVPLDFVNSERDDQYVSVSALGRYLIKEAKGARGNYELTEFLIPAELKPKGLMKVEGKIAGVNDETIPAYISVTDLSTNKRIYSGRPAADGAYFFYLQEGTQYEMAVDPEQSNVTFFATLFDLTGDKIAQKERVNVTLKQLAPGDELVLDRVTFEPYTATLQPSSQETLKRLARLLKANPHLMFEIQVLLNGYDESLVQTTPDQTEMLIDSTAILYEGIDTLAVEQLGPTVLYHNDRTMKQAEAVKTFLVAQGVAEETLTYFVNAIPASDPESPPVTTVKMAIRAKGD